MCRDRIPLVLVEEGESIGSLYLGKFESGLYGYFGDAFSLAWIPLVLIKIFKLMNDFLSFYGYVLI